RSLILRVRTNPRKLDKLLSKVEKMNGSPQENALYSKINKSLSTYVFVHNISKLPTQMSSRPSTTSNAEQTTQPIRCTRPATIHKSRILTADQRWTLSSLTQVSSFTNPAVKPKKITKKDFPGILQLNTKL